MHFVQTMQLSQQSEHCTSRLLRNRNRNGPLPEANGECSERGPFAAKLICCWFWPPSPIGQKNFNAKVARLLATTTQTHKLRPSRGLCSATSRNPAAALSRLLTHTSTLNTTRLEVLAMLGQEKTWKTPASADLTLKLEWPSISSNWVARRFGTSAHANDKTKEVDPRGNLSNKR